MVVLKKAEGFLPYRSLQKAAASKERLLKKAEGFLPLDKEAGMTSFQATKKAESILGAKKSGHTGTLDFGVTGLLMIALGEARKTLPLLMDLDKEYEGSMHMHGDVPDDRIKEAFKLFQGTIIQTPPVRSRVARKPRKREIYSLNFLGRGENTRDVNFSVHCQHGTYIRKLVHDIGEKIGCGAHMARLRRTKIDGFSVEEAKPLSDISIRDIIPTERVLKRLGVKGIWLHNKDNITNKVMNGNPLYCFMIRKHDDIGEGDKAGIFLGRKLLAIGLALSDSGEWKRTKKKPIVKTDRVLKV